MTKIDRRLASAVQETFSVRFLAALLGVIAMVVLTALGASIRIPLPFTPVPITLQTFFVLLSGGLLGRRLGPLSQGGYIFLGSLGVPFFAGGGGHLHILGPTGGYLIGFVIASWAVGRLMDSGEELSFWKVLLAMACGSAVIYLVGSFHLALLAGVTAKQALFMGVLPFVPGDVAKMLAASLICWKFSARLDRISPR